MEREFEEHSSDLHYVEASFERSPTIHSKGGQYFSIQVALRITLVASL